MIMKVVQISKRIVVSNGMKQGNLVVNMMERKLKLRDNDDGPVSHHPY